MRCLRKDPARRFQDAADLKVALTEVWEEGTPAPANRDAGARWKWRWLFVALLVTALSAGAGLSWWLKRTAPASPLLVLHRVTSDTGLTTDPTISPDEPSSLMHLTEAATATSTFGFNPRTAGSQ